MGKMDKKRDEFIESIPMDKLEHFPPSGGSLFSNRDLVLSMKDVRKSGLIPRFYSTILSHPSTRQPSSPKIQGK